MAGLLGKKCSDEGAGIFLGFSLQENCLPSFLMSCQYAGAEFCCVCVQKYVYKCFVCVCVCASAFANFNSTLMINVYIYIYIYICISKYIDMCVCENQEVYICMSFVNVFIYIYKYMNVYNLISSGFEPLPQHPSTAERSTKRIFKSKYYNYN